MTPFQHIEEITGKQRLEYFDSLSEPDKKTFNVYLINLALSMNPALLPLVNEVNRQWSSLNPREVYLVYCSLLPKSKRRYPWVKKQKSTSYPEWVITIMEQHFQINTSNAMTYLDILHATETGKGELKQLLEGYSSDPKAIKKLKLA